MRKITIIDIFNPTKLRDWLNDLMSTGGTPGDKGDTGAKGDTGTGIDEITSSQTGDTVTVKVKLTDGTEQSFTFTTGVSV